MVSNHTARSGHKYIRKRRQSERDIHVYFVKNLYTYAYIRCHQRGYTMRCSTAGGQWRTALRYCSDQKLSPHKYCSTKDLAHHVRQRQAQAEVRTILGKVCVHASKNNEMRAECRMGYPKRRQYSNIYMKHSAVSGRKKICRAPLQCHAHAGGSHFIVTTGQPRPHSDAGRTKRYNYFTAVSIDARLQWQLCTRKIRQQPKSDTEHVKG